MSTPPHSHPTPVYCNQCYEKTAGPGPGLLGSPQTVGGAVSASSGPITSRDLSFRLLELCRISKNAKLKVNIFEGIKNADKMQFLHSEGAPAEAAAPLSSLGTEGLPRRAAPSAHRRCGLGPAGDPNCSKPPTQHRTRPLFPVTSSPHPWRCNHAPWREAHLLHGPWSSHFQLGLHSGRLQARMLAWALTEGYLW